MKIQAFTHLYKVVTPSIKGRLLTRFNEETDDIATFEYYDKVRLPLAVSDVEIFNTYHEITRGKVDKLLELKEQKKTEGILNKEIEIEGQSAESEENSPEPQGED